MSNMKCPFCQQEMICGGTICHYNPDCPIHDNPVPTEILELLDRTRKALNVAVDALKSAHEYYEYCIQRDKDYDSDDINWDCTAMNMDNDISEALEQITALEQKD